jgi:hypothetical protein
MRRWLLPSVFAATAALGSLVTLVTIWSIGPSHSDESSVALASGFGSNTMKIIDQDGTVDVEVWVKNIGRAGSATCAVIVTSNTGQRHHHYQGSAAFSVRSMRPDQKEHIDQVVTGVYYDGDATGPIGSRLLPLPQYAHLGSGSIVRCTSTHVG